MSAFTPNGRPWRTLIGTAARDPQRSFVFPHLIEILRDSRINARRLLPFAVAPTFEVEHWSLTTLREKLVKIGAKVVRHAKYVTFQLAEVAVPRKLFRAILRRIAKFRLAQPRGSPM